MTFERPVFFGKGVFRSNALGYQLTGPAPSGLLADSALRNSNPWVRLAAVLQRAKNGDFSALPVLIECLREADSWVLAQACAELMGDAGSSSFLREVERQFHADLFEEDVLVFQTKLASTFALSGLLWTVPVMLEVYERTADEDDAIIIPLLLSQVLEPQFSKFSSRDLNVTLSDYRKVVLEKYNGLLKQFKSENTPLYGGHLFSVKSLALRLKNRLHGSVIHDVYVAQDRHRFEAATGIDCREVFQEGSVKVLAATAIVEEFLESRESEKYDDGVRYFFGHRIPD